MAQTPMPVIRVLCVENHAVTRRGLEAAFLIHDDMELAGQAESGEEALRLCADLLPDVVLINVGLPGMSAPAVARAVRDRWPTIRVVGLVGMERPGLREEMARAGAFCCVEKAGTSDELMAAIRTAYHTPPAPPETP